MGKYFVVFYWEQKPLNLYGGSELSIERELSVIP